MHCQEIHFDPSTEEVVYQKTLEDEYDGVLDHEGIWALPLIRYLLDTHDDGARINSLEAEPEFRKFLNA